VTTTAPVPALPGDLVAAVDAYRAARLARIDDICALLPVEVPPWSDALTAAPHLQYALAHHLVEELDRAARAGGAVAARSMLATRANAALLLPLETWVGPVVVAGATEDAPGYSARAFDTPALAVGDDARPTADRPDRTLVAEAMARGANAGFTDLLSRNARVVVLLTERALGSEVSSWTTTLLPGTVHLDFHREPVLLARDLVHEAAHTALDDLTRALHVRLPDEPQLFAPWRCSRRPPMAFLHGVWSFAHVVAYCARVDAAGASPETRENLAALHARHTQELRDVAADTERALALVDMPSLAAHIRGVREIALP